MDEIEEFKDYHNGDYVKYSPKELIAGLHTKIDKINDRLSEGSKKITKLETQVFWLKSLLIALYTVLGSVLIKPIRELFQKLLGG